MTEVAGGQAGKDLGFELRMAAGGPCGPRGKGELGARRTSHRGPGRSWGHDERRVNPNFQGLSCHWGLKVVIIIASSFPTT